MNALPSILLVTAAAALGAYLLLLWFRGVRKPVLIGVHVLLGLGAAESLMVFLRMSDIPDESPARRIVLIAAGCLAGALFAGFLAAVIGKGARLAGNALLAVHVISGLAGFVIVLAFVARL